MSYGYNCNNNCKICPNIIISDSVTVVTVNGVDTLLIDIPNGCYLNCCKYCIVVAQTIPTTATINMPVAISIAGNTTTVYPLVNNCCAQVTACGIRTRTKYPVIVSTNATGGVFKVQRNLPCYPVNALQSLPVTTTTTAPASNEAVVSVSEPTVASTKTTKTTPKKEVIENA